MDYQLGILGGMGPQATLTFYQRILARTSAECDQEHIPTLIWSDTQIPDRTAALLTGNAEQVYERLRDGIFLLTRAECSVIAIPCNTSHYFVERLQSETEVPILNMIRETAKRCAELGWKRVGILATDGTVQMGLYQNECKRLGLVCLTPPDEIQSLVMSIIYDEIKRGETGSREKFAEIDRVLHEMGCDGAIL
ncbi:MAG: amino acid racemase, partial [Evtepia sp.]